MKTTVQHDQPTILFNAFAIGSAPLTGNTTFPVNGDNRAERSCLGIIMPMKFHTRIRRTILEGVVLQGTFATLVADRAIERVIEQRELQNTLLRFFHLVGSGFDHHIRHDIHRAGGHQFRHLLDLDQTHPATAERTDLLVITENGDIHIDLFGRIHYFGAFGNRDRFPVNC